MKAQLRYNPHGKVIGPGEISYDHGHVIVKIDSTNCAAGYTCLWQNPDYGGSQADFNGPRDKNLNIRSYLRTEQDSLKNNLGNGAYLSNLSKAVCYPNGAQAPDISPPYNTYGYLYLQEPGKNC
jgi:hypothetical protein